MRMVLTAGVLCAALLLAVTAAVHAAPAGDGAFRYSHLADTAP